MKQDGPVPYTDLPSHIQQSFGSPVGVTATRSGGFISIKQRNAAGNVIRAGRLVEDIPHIGNGVSN